MDTYPQTHIGEGENISANTAKNSWLIRDNLWRTNSRHRTAFVSSIIPLSLPLSYRFRQTRFSSTSWESTNSHIFPLFPFFPSFHIFHIFHDFPLFPFVSSFPTIPIKFQRFLNVSINSLSLQIRTLTNKTNNALTQL